MARKNKSARTANIRRASPAGSRNKLLWTNGILSFIQLFPLIRLMQYLWSGNGVLKKIDAEGRTCFLEGPGLWLVGTDYRFIQVGLVLSFIQLLLNTLIVMFTPSKRKYSCFIGKLGLMTALLQLSAVLILGNFFFSSGDSIFEQAVELQPTTTVDEEGNETVTEEVTGTYFCFKKQNAMGQRLMKFASILWMVSIVMPLLATPYVRSSPSFEFDPSMMV